MKIKHLVLIGVVALTILVSGLIPLFSFISYNASQAPVQTSQPSALVDRN